MVQLAFYTYRGQNAHGSGHAKWPVAYRKLFRVLSCINKPRVAAANRNLYRAYEIRAWKHKGTRVGINRHAHGQLDDYSHHTEVLVRIAQREFQPGADPSELDDQGIPLIDDAWSYKSLGINPADRMFATFAAKTRGDRLVGIRISTPCTACEHAGNELRYQWQTVIPANRWWWPISDSVARDKGILDKASVYRRQHDNMRNLILSHLGRNDFTQIPCQQHVGHAPPHAYTVKFKIGAECILPNLLELDNLDSHHSHTGTADPASTFAIGHELVEHVNLTPHIKYRMIAMTFFNGVHYVASILLHDDWYRYDDVGHKQRKDRPRTKEHLVPCSDFVDAATPPQGYSHRTYVFSFDGVGDADMNRDGRATVPWNMFQEPQFENLDTLAATDDEDGTSPVI